MPFFKPGSRIVVQGPGSTFYDILFSGRLRNHMTITLIFFNDSTSVAYEHPCVKDSTLSTLQLSQNTKPPIHTSLVEKPQLNPSRGHMK